MVNKPLAMPNLLLLIQLTIGQGLSAKPIDLGSVSVTHYQTLNSSQSTPGLIVIIILHDIITFPAIAAHLIDLNVDSGWFGYKTITMFGDNWNDV